MSTRRSRSPRSRKSHSTEAPPGDAVAAVSATVLVAPPQGATDPTQTSQLRAIEAGWDELLA
jgi:hypothetical protein